MLIKGYMGYPKLSANLKKDNARRQNPKGQPGRKVFVFNYKRELLAEYPNIKDCSLKMQTSTCSIRTCANSGRIHRGNYYSFSNFIC
jgi:hypothetical protein